MSISFSEFSSYRTCPHQWWLRYRELWSPPDISRPLSIGTLWHEVLADHYRMLRSLGGKTGDEVEDALTRASVKHLYGPDGEQTEYQELVEWMYLGYLKMYGLDPEWEVLAVEQRINNKLPPRVKGYPVRRATGIIDLVVRWQGNLWLVDHKSHKDIPKEAKLEAEDQMPWYQWLLRQLGKEILGVIYNVGRTHRNKSKPQPLDERFKRFHLHFNDHHLETVAQEASITARKMHDTKTRDDAERTPGATWPKEHCLGCEFRESCFAGRKGMDEDEFMIAKGFRKGG